MPWTDLNALLGLPPESPYPRPMSPLSMLPGDVGQRPGVDIGEVGPSQPRMGPDSEDFVGQAGGMPGQNWLGGSVQGMPGENIGEAGPSQAPKPQPPVSTPKSDMAEFAPLVSTPKSARLPLPAGFGAAAQAPAGEEAAAGVSAPAGGKPAAAASVRPKVDLAKLQLKKAIATELAEKGTPTQRIRGKLALYEVDKELKKIEEGEADAKTAEGIEIAPVDDISKQRGRSLAKLGAKPDKIAEAMGLTDSGLKQSADAKTERERKLTAFTDARSGDDLNTSKLKRASERVFEALKGSGTSGLIGGYTQNIQGSPAYKLKEALMPVKAIIGFDRLQQMRDQSKTGGALGSIAVKELEFLQSVQGSLEIGQDPQTIKENMLAILKAQKLFSNMRKLAPGIEQGDRESIEAYATLSGQLATLDDDVSRMLRNQEKLNAKTLPPSQGKGAEIDARYGVK